MTQSPRRAAACKTRLTLLFALGPCQLRLQANPVAPAQTRLLDSFDGGWVGESPLVPQLYAVTYCQALVMFEVHIMEVDDAE
jgi:hypothetical protein